MKHNLYSVYDKVDQSHQGIAFARNDEAACRDFKRSMNEQNAQLEKNGRIKIDVGDFELHYLGTFDDTTGKITPNENGYVNIPLNIDNNIGA